MSYVLTGAEALNEDNTGSLNIGMLPSISSALFNYDDTEEFVEPEFILQLRSSGKSSSCLKESSFLAFETE
jgi:hypothetical protein